MYLSLFSGFLYKFLFILYFHQRDYGVSRCVCAHAHVHHTWYSSWSVTFTFLDLRFNVFHYNIYEKSLDHYHYKCFFPSFSFPVFWRQLHSHVYWTCWYCITILGCNSVLFTLYVCVPVFVVAPQSLDILFCLSLCSLSILIFEDSIDRSLT